MPPLFALLLIVFVDLLSMTVVVPLLPFYAESFGATETQVGLLVSLYSLGQFVAAPLMGRWSDRWGRKPLLLISQWGTALGLALTALAPSLPFLFAARLFCGFMAGNIVLAQATLSDLSRPEDRTKVFGWFGAVFGLGLTFGPLLSGSLSNHGYRLPLFIAVGLSLVSAKLTLICLPSLAPSSTQKTDQKTEKKRRFWTFTGRQNLRGLYGQFTAFAFNFAYIGAGLGLFMERRLSGATGRSYGARELGFIFGMLGITGIIVQGFLLSRWTKKFGEMKTLFQAFALGILGYTILFASHAPTLFIVGCFLFGFGNSFLRPCLSSLLTRSVDKAEEGYALGLFSAIQSLAQIGAPLLSGLLVAFAGATYWALTLVLINVFGLLFYGSAKNSTQRQ